MKQPVSSFRVGESGKIVSIDSYELQLTLMRLGMVPGEVFELTEVAPLGDPIALRVGDSKIAIRKSDAQKVIAEKI